PHITKNPVRFATGVTSKMRRFKAHQCEPVHTSHRNFRSLRYHCVAGETAALASSISPKPGLGLAASGGPAQIHPQPGHAGGTSGVPHYAVWLATDTLDGPAQVALPDCVSGTTRVLLAKQIKVQTEMKSGVLSRYSSFP